jgi:hypothetical protein
VDPDSQWLEGSAFQGNLSAEAAVLDSAGKILVADPGSRSSGTAKVANSIAEAEVVESLES